MAWHAQDVRVMDDTGFFEAAFFAHRIVVAALGITYCNHASSLLLQAEQLHADDERDLLS